VEQCVRFIRGNSNRPFFLYFAHMHVHLPLYAAERFVRESRNGDFGACVAEIDWSVAVLLYELKRLGIYDDTIIIFTSDNGSRGADGASNAPLRGNKFFTWEGGMRVPCIVHWKSRVAPGTNDCIASNIDLLQTLASVIGAELPEAARDGVDISPMLFSGERVRDSYMYFASRWDNTTALEAVRKGPWKAFFSQQGEATQEL